jgi:hypothetical protein
LSHDARTRTEPLADWNSTSTSGPDDLVSTQKPDAGTALTNVAEPGQNVAVTVPPALLRGCVVHDGAAFDGGASWCSACVVGGAVGPAVAIEPAVAGGLGRRVGGAAARVEGVGARDGAVVGEDDAAADPGEVEALVVGWRAGVVGTRATGGAAIVVDVVASRSRTSSGLSAWACPPDR